MKKRFIFILLILIFTVSLLPVSASPNEIRVIIEGQEVNFSAQTPVIVDDRTLVPVRGVFEALGFEVDWNPDTRTAYLTSADFNVAISIGSPVFTTNDTEHTLDVPAEIIGGSTMLPLRAVLESVGYELEWNEAARTITVTSESAAPEDYIPPGYIIIGGRQFSRSLTSLDLPNRNLSNKDIIPLRYMTNLRELVLRNNQIIDLTPLAELTNLTWLDLNHNQISDLTPLAELTSLTHLHLWGNQISDITPLAELRNLTWLVLNSNQISDITPLAELTTLRWLYLNSNQISDITPLTNLTNLSLLVLCINQITDIAPLADLPNFTEYDRFTTYLMLYGNPITDWSPVEHFINVSGRP